MPWCTRTREVGAANIVELSTLTGSCIVSLGKQLADIWTDSDSLAAELAAASQATGGKTWRMPMVHEYADQLESLFADLKNTGTRWGGSITAALFLQHFVAKGKPFAHVDISGPVWEDGKGATGYGTKLLVEWVTRQGQP
jgi:leucyl aminopeptidase